MSELTITALDVHDDAALAAWYAVYRAAERHGLEDVASTWSLPELTVMLREPSRILVQHHYVGLLDGQVAACGWLDGSLIDNLTSAEVAVQVDPGHRRRGLGTTMLEHLHAEARRLGRPLVNGEVSWPDALGTDGVGWPGREFAVARGYRLTLGDVQRELAVPVDEALLDALEAETTPHHAGYDVRSWVGPVPDQLAQGWVELSASLMTEAPTGDRELEPEQPSIEALRERESVSAKQGRRIVCTAAVGPDGAVAAYSNIAVTPHDSGKAYQWGTLVRRADRGHQLGMAVKLANLRLLQSLDVGATRVITWNAEVNDHMIAINERLGFVVVARAGEFQRRLEA